MEEICETKFCIQTAMPKNWQSENFNNNNNNNNNREVNGCHVMKPCQLSLEINKDPQENCNEIEDTLNLSKENYDEDSGKKELVLLKSNETSVNNSTDNLSYLSDNCLIEEVILIPNISDEEISVNSDDCVYAYRGADFDIAEQRNTHHDDETDFLEMDFDPDPTSEIDNTNESHDLSYNVQHFNTDTTNDVGTINVPSEPQPSIGFTSSKEMCLKKDDIEIISNGVKKDVQRENIDDSPDSPDYEFKTKGAKPKKITEKIIKTQKTSKANNIVDTIFDSNMRQRNICNETDDTCLDCLEKEFLLKTVGKGIDFLECSKCRTKSNYSFESNPLSYKLDEFPNPDRFNNFLHKNYQNNSFNEEILLEKTIKDSTSFFSVDVDEKIIVQALEKLDITFDKDVIRQHFDTAQNRRTFKDVPELIIFMSKKNCDFNKIIKLIKTASKEELIITFTPNPSEENFTEIVQLSTCDILQAWTPQSDLGKLKKLGKRFLQMNVLGKVINLIRQAKQRNIKIMEEFIVIPQYYKSGYICVTKTK